MAKQKEKVIHSRQRSPRRRSSAQDFYTPFKGLDQHSARISRTNSTPPLPAPQSAPKGNPVSESSEDPGELFRKAMSDVIPLDDTRPDRVPPPPPSGATAGFLAQEEQGVYAYLQGLVQGEGVFELTYSDEYVDGAIVGISPKVLKKLRMGEFSYQDHIDLHGLNRKEAREAVTRFVQRSFAG
ncbi:MAG: Smr/MutS family protein, partial [Syntrophobacteraceae bacterium]